MTATVRPATRSFFRSSRVMVRATLRIGKASSMDVGKLARMMARRLLESSSLSRQGFFGAGSSGAACAWPLPLAAVVIVDEGWAVVVSASRCGARRVWMRASAYEHGSSGYHAGYDATGRVGWGVQRVGARALVRPLPPLFITVEKRGQ